MIGLLPDTLTVGGVAYPIRTDYRDILTIIQALNDPDLKAEEKLYVCLCIVYIDYDKIPTELYEEAYKQASWFIDLGEEPDDKPSNKVMDWEQDERILFPAINAAAGFEVRTVSHLHWWTFMGYFMEIREGTFSQVISLRQKRIKGKKLEKWEREYWTANKKLCVLKPKLTAEEKEKKDKLLELIGG